MTTLEQFQVQDIALYTKYCCDKSVAIITKFVFLQNPKPPFFNVFLQVWLLVLLGAFAHTLEIYLYFLPPIAPDTATSASASPSIFISNATDTTASTHTSDTMNLNVIQVYVYFFEVIFEVFVQHYSK